jgi:hypothetical protein
MGLVVRLVGLAATLHAKSRAPITARRRPRPSKYQGYSFGTNGFAVGAPSLPGGAGIPGFHAQRHHKTHYVVRLIFTGTVSAVGAVVGPRRISPK